MSDQPSWMKNFVPDHTTPPHRFKPGQSGNPKGRPPGVSNKREQVAKAITDALPEILSVVRAKALQGDMAAAALLLARGVPTLRPRAEKVEFTLDPAGNLYEQAREVLQALACGQLDPDTAKGILDSIGAFSGLREREELIARIAKLEQLGSSTSGRSRGGVLALGPVELAQFQERSS